MAHDFKQFPELTKTQMEMYYFDSPHKQVPESFTAKVVSVHDGDTVRLYWKERDFTFPLRLLNIDSPELNEQGGQRCQKWLENLIFNQEVDIIVDPDHRVEKWGRLLGEILFMGMNINELSLIEGMSVPFERRGEKNAFANIA